MFYITGDTHGTLDFAKVRSFQLAHPELTKDDYLIITGDFGFLWEKEPDAKERQAIDWFDNCPWTTLFVDGNHENHLRLAQFPEEDWCGGHVHRIGRSLYHLMRGQVYNIDGRTFFTMGGARSIDKDLRTPGLSWWPEEEPSEEEYAEAIQNLQKANWNVQYVLTHELPTKQMKELDPLYRSYQLTDWLDEIREKLDYRSWFAGHHHCDKSLSDHVCVLYDFIVPLEEPGIFGSFKNNETDHKLPLVNDLENQEKGNDSKVDPSGPIIGKPLYYQNEWVSFRCRNEVIVGQILIVDSYGTFEQKEQPSYDIIAYERNMLYKHIVESEVNGLVAPTEEQLKRSMEARLKGR